jgi:hypothetical protein
MPVTSTNRRRQLYYLHGGLAKAGRPRYWFSMKADGDPVDAIPEGFEIYENPNAQVFLRKIRPQVVTPEEVAVVRDGLKKRFAPDQNCLVDLRDEHIVVHHSERDFRGEEIVERIFGFRPREPLISCATYTAVMRFTLVDAEARTFRAQRWCFRGSVDRWIDLAMSKGDRGALADLVKRFAPHIGQESFFELM